MRSREDLFHLIQSMSKSEKRYFVLDANKSGRSASRYLTLFDAINGMEEYDEEALKKKFPKNLSSDKGYLYESILRSMRDYRSSASKAAQVKERLMDARYLYERGLYEQSTERIMQAKAMSMELEDQFTLLEINKEEQVSLFDRRATVQLEHIEKLNEERARTMEAINEEMKYLDLYYRLGLEVYKEYNLKDELSIEALKKRLPAELLDETNKPKSPQALRRFYLCNAVYYNLLGDQEKVYHYYAKVLEWWERFPVLKEEEFHKYINNVHNLINISYKLERHTPAAQQWLDRLKQEKPANNYHNQKIIFRLLSISNLLHSLNRNDFENARKLLPEIIEGINKFGLKKSIVLIGNITTVYFLVKDYKNCIKWADFIIKNLKASGREDIQRVVRIYKIISEYELGNIDRAEADMRSANRYFKSINLPKGRFDDQVVNVYLKHLFNSPLNEVKTVQTEFTSFLEDVKANPKAENLLGVDELLIWLENRRK